jgi:hypothetical protein
MKIGEFYLQHYDGFWSSKSPVEDVREDSLPYVTIEKKSGNYHIVSVMGGKWCEQELFGCQGSFSNCVILLKQWCEDRYRKKIVLDLINDLI